MLTKNALLALFLLPVFFFLRHYRESWQLLSKPQVALCMSLIYAVSILGYQVIMRMGVPPLKSSLIIFVLGLSIVGLEPLQRLLAHLTHNSPLVGFQFMMPVWIVLNALVIRKLLVMNARLFKPALLINLGVILLVIFELFLGIKNSTESKRNNMAVSGKNSLGIARDSNANPQSGKQFSRYRA